MPEEIGSYEAKTKLPEILRRVEAGEAFTVTIRGRAIANILKAKKHRISDAESITVSAR